MCPVIDVDDGEVQKGAPVEGWGMVADNDACSCGDGFSWADISGNELRFFGSFVITFPLSFTEPIYKVAKKSQDVKWF